MDHKERLLADQLLSFMNTTKLYNGFTDSNQVIAWYVGGEFRPNEGPPTTPVLGAWMNGEVVGGDEIARSENAELTVTPKFKELALEVIDSIFS